jgi:hypothetical protein
MRRPSGVRSANGNILQVWIGRRQTPCCRDGLVIRSVNSARALVDLQWQLVGVGALEFADAAVIDNDGRQLVIVGQLGKDVLCRRWLPLGRLPDDRQFELFEKNLLQLLW